LTILKPGDPTDDIPLDPGKSFIRDAGFEITSYIVSRTTALQGEVETLLADVKQLKPRKVSFLEDAGTGTALVESVDYLTGVDPFADGTLVSVVNGVSASLPGWFIGTAIDFSMGTVTGPFTGSAEFLGSGLEVATTAPEPTSIGLLTVGLIGLVGVHCASRSIRAQARTTRLFSLEERAC
jgi:hypothetical protein